MKRNRLALVLSCLTLTALSGSASAERDATRKADRYEVATKLSNIKAGGASIKVDAPMSVVKDVVTEFGKYDERITKFEKSHVVGKHGDKTDVYLQVPILKGVSKVWAIVRFDPAKKVSDTEELIEARMVKGNVKRLNAWWRLKKLDDKTTKLSLELLIEPDLPVPASLVTDETRGAAIKAVFGLRKTAELRVMKE